MTEVTATEIMLNDVHALIKLSNKGRMQLWEDTGSESICYNRAIGGHSISGLDQSRILRPVGEGVIPPTTFHGT